MGNHTAGELANTNVLIALANRKADEPALSVLDRAMEKTKAASGFSPDAEFEAADPNNPGHVHPDFHDYRYPHEKNPMGLLLVEAFAPNGLADLDRYINPDDLDDDQEEELTDRIWDEIITPFSDRYGLC